MVPMFEQIKKLANSDGWIFIEDKDGVAVDYKKSDRDITIARVAV